MVYSARKDHPMHLIDAALCVSDRQEDMRDTSFSGNVVTDFITPLPSLLPRYRLYFITTVTDSRLNAELTLYQVLPGMAFLIHFMVNA